MLQLTPSVITSRYSVMNPSESHPTKRSHVEHSPSNGKSMDKIRCGPWCSSLEDLNGKDGFSFAFHSTEWVPYNCKSSHCTDDTLATPSTSRDSFFCFHNIYLLFSDQLHCSWRQMSVEIAIMISRLALWLFALLHMISSIEMTHYSNVHLGF